VPDAGPRQPACPDLDAIEVLPTGVPGTGVVFAHARRFAVTNRDTAQLLVLDDAQANLGAFVASDGGKGCSALCESITDCVPSLPRCTYIGFGIDRSICSP
jgi:hypothetical protein